MNIALDITDETLRNILCCAFEGGANYWIDSIDAVLASGISLDDFDKGGERQPKGHYWHWSQLVPLTEGCAVVITVQDEPGKTFRLDRDAIQKGLKVMATKCPKHFGDLLAENEDATTGDVFVQCCIFGEVVYG